MRTITIDQFDRDHPNYKAAVQILRQCIAAREADGDLLITSIQPYNFRVASENLSPAYRFLEAGARFTSMRVTSGDSGAVVLWLTTEPESSPDSRPLVVALPLNEAWRGMKLNSIGGHSTLAELVSSAFRMDYGREMLGPPPARVAKPRAGGGSKPVTQPRDQPLEVPEELLLPLPQDHNHLAGYGDF